MQAALEAPRAQLRSVPADQLAALRTLASLARGASQGHAIRAVMIEITSALVTGPAHVASRAASVAASLVLTRADGAELAEPVCMAIRRAIVARAAAAAPVALWRALLDLASAPGSPAAEAARISIVACLRDAEGGPAGLAAAVAACAAAGSVAAGGAAKGPSSAGSSATPALAWAWWALGAAPDRASSTALALQAALAGTAPGPPAPAAPGTSGSCASATAADSAASAVAAVTALAAATWLLVDRKDSAEPLSTQDVSRVWGPVCAALADSPAEPSVVTACATWSIALLRTLRRCGARDGAAATAAAASVAARAAACPACPPELRGRILEEMALHLWSDAAVEGAVAAAWAGACLAVVEAASRAGSASVDPAGLSADPSAVAPLRMVAAAAWCRAMLEADEDASDSRTTGFGGAGSAELRGELLRLHAAARHAIDEAAGRAPAPSALPKQAAGASAAGATAAGASAAGATAAGAEPADPAGPLSALPGLSSELLGQRLPWLVAGVSGNAALGAVLSRAASTVQAGQGEDAVSAVLLADALGRASLAWPAGPVAAAVRFASSPARDASRGWGAEAECVTSLLNDLDIDPLLALPGALWTSSAGASSVALPPLSGAEISGNVLGALLSGCASVTAGQRFVWAVAGAAVARAGLAPEASAEAAAAASALLGSVDALLLAWAGALLQGSAPGLAPEARGGVSGAGAGQEAGRSASRAVAWALGALLAELARAPAAAVRLASALASSASGSAIGSGSTGRALVPAAAALRCVAAASRRAPQLTAVVATFATKLLSEASHEAVTAESLAAAATLAELAVVAPAACAGHALAPLWRLVRPSEAGGEDGAPPGGPLRLMAEAALVQLAVAEKVAFVPVREAFEASGAVSRLRCAADALLTGVAHDGAQREREAGRRSALVVADSWAHALLFGASGAVLDTAGAAAAAGGGGGDAARSGSGAKATGSSASAGDDGSDGLGGSVGDGSDGEDDGDDDGSESEDDEAGAEISRSARRLWRVVLAASDACLSLRGRRGDSCSDASRCGTAVAFAVSALSRLPAPRAGVDAADAEEWSEAHGELKARAAAAAAEAADTAAAAAGPGGSGAAGGGVDGRCSGGFTLEWQPEREPLRPWFTGRALLLAAAACGVGSAADRMLARALRAEANLEGWNRPAASLEVRDVRVAAPPAEASFDGVGLAALLPKPRRCRLGALDAALRWVVAAGATRGGAAGSGGGGAVLGAARAAVAARAGIPAAAAAVAARSPATAAYMAAVAAHLPIGGAGSKDGALAVVTTAAAAAAELGTDAGGLALGAAAAWVASAHAPHCSACAVWAAVAHKADAGSAGARGAVPGAAGVLACTTRSVAGALAPEAARTHAQRTWARVVAGGCAAATSGVCVFGPGSHALLASAAASVAAALGLARADAGTGTAAAVAAACARWTPGNAHAALGEQIRSQPPPGPLADGWWLEGASAEACARVFAVQRAAAAAGGSTASRALDPLQTVLWAMAAGAPREGSSGDGGVVALAAAAAGPVPALALGLAPAPGQPRDEAADWAGVLVHARFARGGSALGVPVSQLLSAGLLAPPSNERGDGASACLAAQASADPSGAREAALRRVVGAATGEARPCEAVALACAAAEMGAEGAALARLLAALRP